MAAFLQTAHPFSWTKTIVFWFKFHWNLFPKIQQYAGISSGNGLALNRRQAIIWTNDGEFTDAYMHHTASMS